MPDVTLESLIRFVEFSLSEPILTAVANLGYTRPTPIQEQSIPLLLKGRDLLGIAQTGTGKTAAFALPILQRLAASGEKSAPRSPRALVLTPTRELAQQVHQSFADYGENLPLESAVIFGGVGDAPQKKALNKGVDILVATPGRLLDLVGQGALHLQRLEIFVLDEADRMLDMGFIHDIRKVVALLPAERQNLFFSATMPRDIVELSSTILTNPARVEVVPQSTPIERIDQQLYHVDKQTKPLLLLALLQNPTLERVLVFTRMKHVANRLSERLKKAGIAALPIHGNKSQTRRNEAMGSFRDGRLRVLVATDIAARGIDVDGVTHVINYDLPDVGETYVHRIGRTARAGANGVAISFCSAEEKAELKAIERLIGRQIPLGQELPPEQIAEMRAANANQQVEERERPQRPARPQQRRRRPTSPGAPSPTGEPKQGRERKPQQSRELREERSPNSARSRPSKRKERPAQTAASSKRNPKKRAATTTSASPRPKRSGAAKQKPSRNSSTERRSSSTPRESTPHPGAASPAKRLIIGLGKLFS